ncbi:MAG TPA: ATP synthase F0 subunit C [Candidatus Onthovivens sp.]|nr:ATP synthase F0 subunit C [Candidatus Onthovivens sp.]
MNFLVNLATVLADTGMSDKAYAYIAIGICALSMGASGLGEGFICAKTMEGMSRNPEMYGKLRTGMILGCALTETTAIYALLLAILLLFLG